MKGFAITLDAVVALSFFLLAIALITIHAYPPRASGEIYLKQLSLDALTVLEKTGAMEEAAMGNTTHMQELLEATPKLACMDVTVLDPSGDVVLTAVKSDCNETAGLNMQAAARPFLYQGDTYVIKSESWFRKEPD